MDEKDKKVYPIQPIGKGPRRAKIPYHRARRWLANGENGQAPALQVFVTQHAYNRICAHAASDMDNEVGGWLAGRWCKDYETKKEFVVVEALLPAQQVRSGSTFLTFTHDSQVAMLAALEERYSKKGVVGWYHTHPRMGIFLSGYDVWLHDHFFPQPWQVALVVEPHTGVGGFFIRNKDKKLDPRKYFGFYELQNRRAESVVNWQNLRLDKKEEVKKEEAKKQEMEAAEAKQNAKPRIAATVSGAKKQQSKRADEQAQESKHEVKSGAQPVVKDRAVELKKESRLVELQEPDTKKVTVKTSEDKKVEPVGLSEKAAQPVSKKMEIETGEPQNLDVKRPELKINVHKKDVEIKSEQKPEIKNSEEAKS